jgi:dihydrodiol dehydrogenase / D-xylose 1-dehydrogenase (NADP)
LLRRCFAKARIHIFVGILQVGGPFWTPTTIVLTSNEEDDWCEDYAVPSGAEFPFHFMNSGSLVHEADHVRDCLKKGLKESPLVSHDDSLKIAEIQGEIISQLGVSYN